MQTIVIESQSQLQEYLDNRLHNIPITLYFESGNYVIPKEAVPIDISSQVAQLAKFLDIS